MAQYRAIMPAPSAEAARLVADAIEAAAGEDVAVSWFEEPDGWPVSAYWDGERPDLADAVFGVALSHGLEVEIGELPNVDWVAESLRGLPPVRAGRFLVHGSHDRGKRRANEIGVEIEAAQAFGTGHHGTTAGCLEVLDRLGRTRRFRAPLDLGTGSGVLAIAMAKAWGVPVLASDIDPVAVRIANSNARLNHVGGSVEAVTAAGFRHPLLRDGRFDLIVANILAGPLGALATDVARRLASGGTVVLSGLIPQQRRFIIARYRSRGLRLQRSIVRDGWLTLVFRGQSVTR
ncbi:MAG: 50S ribosomal protein L11 methyltransferase [Bauldia sp.]|nr:50S ribosomal protein L11 methyltransferase [Bauldia sp.]